MPRILTQLRVDEISSVDKAAGEGCKVVLYKRDSDERRQRIRRLHRHIVDGRGGDAAPNVRSEEGPSNGDTNAPPSHISRLADLIAEASQGAVSRADAIAWLLTHAHGRAMLTHTNKKDDTMTDDLVTLAKRIADTGATHLSEHEAFELVQKYCNLHRLTGEKPAAAFSRIYGGDDDVGTAFRKMVQVAKGHPHPHL